MKFCQMRFNLVKSVHCFYYSYFEILILLRVSLNLVGCGFKIKYEQKLLESEVIKHNKN